MSIDARRQLIARAIWTAMVDDEPPPDGDTIWREGYLDAADAVISLVGEIGVVLDADVVAKLDRRAALMGVDRAGYLHWVLTGKVPTTKGEK